MSVRQGGNVIAGVAKGDKFPAGIIAPFAGTAIPEGWLLCDGSAVSRTDYADLFNAIGTTYGAGDGSSTFNLPSLIDRLPWRSGNQQYGYKTNGMIPNITGTLNTTGAVGPAQRSSTSGGTGALSHKEIASAFYAGAGGVQNYTTGISFDASRVSSVYTSNTGIVMPSVLFITGWIIKY